MHIEELIKSCESLCKSEDFVSLESFASAIDQVPIEGWEKYVVFENDCYKRNVVFRNERFEFILICWDKGQSTPLHDHPHQGCIMRVLEGELTEERIHKNNKSSHILLEGQISFMCNDYGEHVVYNSTDKKSISLHIYSPPDYYEEYQL